MLANSIAFACTAAHTFRFQQSFFCSVSRPRWFTLWRSMVHLVAVEGDSRAGPSPPDKKRRSRRLSFAAVLAVAFFLY